MTESDSKDNVDFHCKSELLTTQVQYVLSANLSSEYNETSVIANYSNLDFVSSKFSLHIESNYSLLIVEEEVGN